MRKQRWCSSVDEETTMMIFGNKDDVLRWMMNGGWGVGGGRYWRSLLLANKDDVLRWMRKRRWCSFVDVECVCNGGWGVGGVIGVRCCLQTKMMFFGGWGNKDGVLRWRGGGGFGRSLLLANKDDVLRWMRKLWEKSVVGELKTWKSGHSKIRMMFFVYHFFSSKTAFYLHEMKVFMCFCWTTVIPPGCFSTFLGLESFSREIGIAFVATTFWLRIWQDLRYGFESGYSECTSFACSAPCFLEKYGAVGTKTIAPKTRRPAQKKTTSTLYIPLSNLIPQHAGGKASVTRLRVEMSHNPLVSMVIMLSTF